MKRIGRALDRVLRLDSLLTIALLGGLTLLRLRTPIRDPDLGWHLAAGARMLDTLRIPTTDPFSYVTEGQAWTLYSWLAEVLLACVHRAAGAGGLVLLSAAVILVTHAILLASCRRAGARHSISVLATLAAAAVSAPTWTIRPHLLSFLLLATFQHVLLRDRTSSPTERPSSVWWLVPLSVLWANVHVYFCIGLGFVGLDVLTNHRRWVRGDRGRVPISRLAVLTLLPAATLLNPYGWRLWQHVLQLANHEVAFAMIGELQTPSLHQPHGQLLTAFFFATVLALILSPLRKRAVEILNVLSFAFLAFSMARNMPLFAIVAAPVFARHFDALLPAPQTSALALSSGRRGLHTLALATLGLLLTIGVRRTPAPSDGGLAVSPTRFPVAAVSFLRAQPDLGRMFNHFNWGGYLITALYPRYQVSMDGRTALYGDELLLRYRATQRMEPRWREFLDRCDPGVVLWRKGDPFVRGLELLPEWKLLYEDDLAVIFVREDPDPRRSEDLDSAPL